MKIKTNKNEKLIILKISSNCNIFDQFSIIHFNIIFCIKYSIEIANEDKEKFIMDKHL